MIISGPGEQSGKWYTEFAKIVPRLRKASRPRRPAAHSTGDYVVDEKKRTVGILRACVWSSSRGTGSGIDNL
ncbi:hypothetical protein [Nonomuraea dietziae]|uniref:hypothetical protein n=1 Tax=Nonomuraea dietziae TaxID=65515 RepID=UPI0031D82D12